jgi:hypothetical protein
MAMILTLPYPTLSARLYEGAADLGEERVQRVEQPHAAEALGEAAPIAGGLDARARLALRQRRRDVPGGSTMQLTRARRPRLAARLLGEAGSAGRLA